MRPIAAFALSLACLAGTPAAVMAQETGTALAAAARQGQDDAVERLLAAGADPDAQDARGATALMEATRAGHYATVQRLLKHGARKDLVDAEGRTALDLAFRYGRNDLIALLRDAS